MRHAVAVEPLFRSRTGRTELHAEQFGVRLLAYGLDRRLTSTDLLDGDDVHQLLHALAVGRDRTALLAAAASGPDLDEYALFDVSDELTAPAKTCEDCGRTIRNALPWWEAGQPVRLIGPGCFRQRQDERARGSAVQAEALPYTDQEGGTRA